MRASVRVASKQSRMSNPLVMSDLWIDVLQRVNARAAHELKGALNGVSVNLEVVRSRAERPDALASAVNTYAHAAAKQLDIVIALSDALLALGRPAREPVDIGLATRQLATLLTAAARSDGGCLALDPVVSELGQSSATGNAVRATIGAGMLAAIDSSKDVRCAPSADGSKLLIMSGDETAFVVGDEIIAAAAEVGIRVEYESNTLSITFPH